jgi:beta-xylosidase
VYLCVSRLLPLRGPPEEAGSVIFGNEIDINTGNSLSQPVMLRQSRHSCRCTEGPHLFKKDGWYYLLVAEGGTATDHQARIARSRDPLGPFVDPPEGVNPILFNGHDKVVQNTGHADLVQDVSGRWWAYFLAVRIQANGFAPLGRETFLASVEWNDDGWPILNGGKPIGLGVDGSSLPPQQPFTGWRDDFEKGSWSIIFLVSFG